MILHIATRKGYTKKSNLLYLASFGLTYEQYIRRGYCVCDYVCVCENNFVKSLSLRNGYGWREFLK